MLDIYFPLPILGPVAITLRLGQLLCRLKTTKQSYLVTLKKTSFLLSFVLSRVRSSARSGMCLASTVQLSVSYWIVSVEL